MTTGTTDVGRIQAATSAILGWPHRRGGSAHCLIQLRTLEGPGEDVATTVIASELRTNPPGRGASTDFAGLAAAAADHIIPAARRGEAIVWVVHHGPFSTYDHTEEPDTYTQVHLEWDQHTGYLDPGPHAHRLLTDAEAADLVAALRLEAVEDVLRAWSWTEPPGSAPAHPSGRAGHGE